jgi:hypothetical protein
MSRIDCNLPRLLFLRAITREDLLSDYSVVEKAQAFRESLPDETLVDLVKCLDMIIRTCKCYSTSPENKKIREETSQKESELEMNRNRMKLGYTDKEGAFKAMSSVGLRNTMRTTPEEETRKAAYEGLRNIGPFVCENGFVDIIKMRNKLAKSLGFVDYYDYKVTNAEGMSKAKLFEILDGLEEGTRPIMDNARKELEKRFGSDALQPCNQSFKMAGSIIKKMVSSFTHDMTRRITDRGLTVDSHACVRIHTFHSRKRPSVIFARMRK